MELDLEAHGQAVFDDPVGEIAGGDLFVARRKEHCAARRQIELGDLISDSTSSIATDARDGVRVQAMNVDGGLARVVDRLLRRKQERDVLVPGFQLRGAT